MPGTATSKAEVTRVSLHGLWVRVDGRELFLSFEEFPWFRGATAVQVSNVERPRARYLRWPDLDVDLTLDSIEHPEKYPLVSRRG